MQIGWRLLPKVHTLLFRSTESEISLDAINVCGVERRDSSDSFRSLHPFGRFREIRLPIRCLRPTADQYPRTRLGHCGEGGTARKIPVASQSGDAIFATSVFRPIRVWGVSRLGQK